MKKKRRSALWSIVGREIMHSAICLEYYADTVERVLARERKQFEKMVAKEMEELTDAEREMIEDSYIDDHEMLSDFVPETARRSLFLTIYSQFEDLLLSVCKVAQRLKKESFGPRDLKGEFSGAAAFLKGICNINIQKTNEFAEATKVKHYRLIRNAIAHQGGYVTKDQATLNDFIANTKGISLKDDQIHVTKDFCIEAMEDLHTYVQSICDEAESSL
ncbi:hypothetical protein Pan258_01910 [Symmachiella dynata]|uniref:hypothetical protein n=1 Tax=Symmachiella dynata TaxID=2527995 RepID=UPI00118B9D77|nr:hypothetical protein [Symmachiella dynata]QDT46174.1 hypothetical protein Pan258_01910 [Symmachiella dynata]